MTFPSHTQHHDRSNQPAAESAVMGTEQRRSALYLKAILGQAVRVLSLLDREEFSSTFGCLDRTFWAWKFTDFPGARFQEGLCTLSFLYATPFDGNPYHAHPKLASWIAAGFDFWAQIQRSDGSFDEAYPFEHSLAATAFTSFYLGEAWGFLEADLPAPTAARFKAAMEKAGDWLIHNEERHGFLSNHLAAAAAALIHAHRICAADRFEKRSRYFVERILSHQSSEGWYDEYGGADPGYQTHGSFYLARYQQLTGDEKLCESLDRASEFLAQFVHPDRSLGGEYTSRNTQTYYPAAFEILAPRSPAARWIAGEMSPAVQSLSAAGLGTVDFYNFFPLLNNYVFAYKAARDHNFEKAAPDNPQTGPGVLHYPKAGLLKVRRPRYDLFVGLNKGGVLKLFDRVNGRLAFAHCGYIGRLRNRRVFSSQCASQEYTLELKEKEIDINSFFYEVSRPVMRPGRFVSFRLFTLTVGRIKAAANWIKMQLVRRLVYNNRRLNLKLSRRIVLLDDRIEIVDRIQGPIGDRIEKLLAGDIFTTIHMGSSRYFLPNELQSCWQDRDEMKTPVNPDQLQTGVIRRHRVSLD